MALTRPYLKGMNLTEEQISAIIEEHDNTISGLKKVRDQYKADAEKLPQVQKELDDLKAGNSSWEDKYNSEHAAFEKYKSEAQAKENQLKIEGAYRDLLKANNIGEKQIDAIVRVTDFSKFELDENGKFKEESKISESIKSDWAAFVTTTSTSGANVDNPPGGTGAMTREEFDKMPLSKRMEYANAHPAEVAGFYK